MKQISIYSEQLEHLFKTVKDAISTDEARPILKWIKVEVRGNKLKAIALDGYMLSTIEIEAMKDAENGDEDYDFFIQPFYIPKYKAGCEVKFNSDENDCVVVTVRPITKRDTLVYRFYQPNTPFIEWEKVIPETSKDLRVSVDAGRLMRLLKGYQNNQLNNNMVTLSFVQKENGNGINPIQPVLFEQKTKTGVTRQAILLPIRSLED